jgi:hypothetical protein
VRVGGAQRLDRKRHYTDRFGHLDLVVRRDFLESSGATYPEDMSIAEDLTFYNTLLFSLDDPHAVRVASGSYYYRLAPTSRTAGSRQAAVVMADRVAAATGNQEFVELDRRWRPVHVYLAGRVERQLEAEGRLGPMPELFEGIEAPEDPNLGRVALVGIKGLQWMGRWVDRRDRPAVAEDIARQLSRSV